MGEQALSQAAKKKSQAHYGADVAIAGVECERRHVFISSKGAESGKRAEQDRRKGDKQIGSRCVAVVRQSDDCAEQTADPSRPKNSTAATIGVRP